MNRVLEIDPDNLVCVVQPEKMGTFALGSTRNESSPAGRTSRMNLWWSQSTP